MDEPTVLDEKKLPWYFRNSSIIIAFVCVGPLALPMVWFHPKMSGSKKILWTTVTLVLTYFMVQISIDSIKKIMEYYQQLKAAM